MANVIQLLEDEPLVRQNWAAGISVEDTLEELDDRLSVTALDIEVCYHELDMSMKCMFLRIAYKDSV